jgi:hypothetical protein
LIQRLRARSLPVRTTGLAIGLVLALAGCTERREAVPDIAPRSRGPRLPQALMVRFQEVKGTGFSRESWELEVLQLGGDIRLRGAIRTGGSSVPLLDVMTPEEYEQFWDWLKTFPLERARPAEDPSAPKEEWRKTLAVDIVLDEETRWKSRTTWSRPLADAPWVASIEQRLHALALDLANREVQRQEREATGGGPAGDAPSTDPGGYPSGAGGPDAD